MTTSYEANITQVVPWVQHSRDAFLKSEMTAVEKVSTMASLAPGQTPRGENDIYTDYLYGILLLKEFHVPEDKIIDASQIYTEEIDRLSRDSTAAVSCHGCSFNVF
jgi:hypothetical protein